MDKFGFTLSKGRQIDYDSNNRKLAEFIISKEPTFRLCIECGACSATCTSGNLTRFSLREMNILIKRGENEQVRKNIRKCMFCGKCSLVCPRGVNTRNVINLVIQSFRKNGDNEF